MFGDYVDISYFHLPHEPKLTYHVIINQLSCKDLSMIYWDEEPITKEYRKDLIRIHYASLNFKDVILATNKIASDVITQDGKELDLLVDFEYSGITINSRRIMGFNQTTE
ncbi:fatty acid synthase-like [Vespula squamosa]|uniref:Fatty acid synthase-like n=1 Tax=Vespula squamosa TaxID=30214 RepID=A0ABD2A5I5_VESSQ